MSTQQLQMQKSTISQENARRLVAVAAMQPRCSSEW